MQNKLQELTDKLYNEGLSKGKQEAEQMMANAKNEAAQIIAQAKEQAQEILAKAQNDAAELKSKTENDVKMASLQAFTAVKQQIESVITAKTLAPAKAAVAETEFLKEIVKAIVTAFNPQNSDSVALEIILPAEKQAELEQFAAVIDLRDRNILVSAAAGSGKTAVLVERIIKRITEADPPQPCRR